MAVKALPAHTGPISSLLPVNIAVKKFSTIPEDVEAVQFKDWTSAISIFSFADGFFFVGRGYEHIQRKPEEFDRSSGHVLDNAAEFLVFKSDQGEYRIDLGFWIVKKATGDVQVIPNDVFSQRYSENTF